MSDIAPSCLTAAGEGTKTAGLDVDSLQYHHSEGKSVGAGGFWRVDSLPMRQSSKGRRLPSPVRTACRKLIS